MKNTQTEKKINVGDVGATTKKHRSLCVKISERKEKNQDTKRNSTNI